MRGEREGARPRFIFSLRDNGHRQSMAAPGTRRYVTSPASPVCLATLRPDYVYLILLYLFLRFSLLLYRKSLDIIYDRFLILRRQVLYNPEFSP